MQSQEPATAIFLLEVPNNRTGIVIELKYAGDGDLDAACAEALKQMEEKIICR